MLVRMLKLTRYKAEPVFPKSTQDVPADIAARWIKAGIAEAIDSVKTTSPSSTEVEPPSIDAAPIEVPVHHKPVAGLKEMLKELEVPIPHNPKRATLITMVNAARKRAQKGGDDEL